MSTLDVWRVEAALAEVEPTFAPLFDSDDYHRALRHALSERHGAALGELRRFAALPPTAQTTLVESVFTTLKGVASPELAPKLAHEARAKEAIRRHLTAMPLLDRRITKKIFAPPRASWPRRALNAITGLWM